MSAWPPATVRSRLVDLHEAVDSLQTLPKGSPGNRQTALARYVTVRSAGYLEAVRDDVAGFFVERISVDLVTKRIRSGLGSGQGVAPKQLVDFVASFHTPWGVELTSLLNEDDSLLGNRLGALVASRKKIAHGDGDNVTPKRALEWASTAEVVGAWIVKRFDPARDFYAPVVHMPS